MDEKYSIYSKFNLEQHKKTFVNYLEVIVLEDGTVQYAIPSHQEAGIRLACQKLGVDRKTLNDMCPREYWFDFLNWLSMISGVMFVWNEFVMVNEPTRKQIAILKKMKMSGVYKGTIPLISATKGEKQKNG